MPCWTGGGAASRAGGVDGARLAAARLYFDHFTTTSFVVERDGEIAAFLIGFLSQTEPGTAYVHFAGVDPALHGQGVGRALYQAFFAIAQSYGRHHVRCVTSPENSSSQAFHVRLGFTASAVKPDYDGPGLDRVTFSIELPVDAVAVPRRSGTSVPDLAGGRAGMAFLGARRRRVVFVPQPTPSAAQGFGRSGARHSASRPLSSASSVS
ncbi:GNAT family N-acetyltransferase [Streptomyces zhihengii]